MVGVRVIGLVFFASLLITCNGAPAKQQPTQVNASSAHGFTAEEYTRFREASCSNPDEFVTPQPISLTTTPVAPDTLKGAELNNLSFVGGWHLTSDEPNFGGLSGLAVHPKDHLLAISDGGAFVWLSMLEGAPSGFAAISYMRGKNGQPLQGKSDTDSEGLDLVDGLALVSFERNHRIMAFDVANCGAAANGVLVARIPKPPSTIVRKIPDNEGAEALLVDAAKNNRMIAGLEMQARQGAPIVDLSPSGTGSWSYMPRPADKRLVGLDGFGGTTFALYRNYIPLLGNNIEIHAHYLGNPEPTILATLKRPFPVDNFEGITATRLPDGAVRLYIISDDNFSDKQRTLLMAFDVITSDNPAN